MLFRKAWQIIPSFKVLHPLGSCLFPFLQVIKNLAFTPRAEGSSKVQSRIEQQQQQMRNATKVPNSVPNNVKNSPPKEKMFPSSPMDDIERGKLHWRITCRNSSLN